MAEAFITRRGGFGIEGGQMKTGFFTNSTTSVGANYKGFTITGLGFKPAHIVIMAPYYNMTTKTVDYFEWMNTGEYHIIAKTTSNTGQTKYTGTDFDTDKTCDLTITDDGFVINVYSISGTFFYSGCYFRSPIYWMAFEEVQTDSYHQFSKTL